MIVWLTLLWHLAKACLWNTLISVVLLITKIDLQVKSSFVRNPTTEHTDKTSAGTVLASWFSIKKSDGIQLPLMNSYQIPEAMLFWAPQWEAACRRVFLYVQNDKTLQILFCIWQVFSVSASVFHSNLFPNVPFLHKLTRCKSASVLLFIICLRLQVNTH